MASGFMPGSVSALQLMLKSYKSGHTIMWFFHSGKSAVLYANNVRSRRAHPPSS